MSFETEEKLSNLTANQTEAANLENSRIDRLCKILAKKDFLFLPANITKELLASIDPSNALDDWDRFAQSWDQLCVDSYMADGGQYRKRRHATLSALPSSTLIQTEMHQPHYQSLTYNNLNGGIARHYEPIENEVLHSNSMTALLRMGCNIFGRVAPYYPWHIEVHQFRIEALAGKAGKPTPEGIHRDGVNFVMMIMIQRKNLINGSTTIYDLEKTRLDEFTLQQPLDIAIVNDEHVFHGVTPIVQLDTGTSATRDVLVITFRRKN